MASETSWSGETTKKTPREVVYGDNSSVNSYEVTEGNCKVRIISYNGTSGDITFTYVLENDREDNASILAEYSTTGIDGTWAAATSAGGDDGTDDLTTSAEGTSHTYIWNTVTDLGVDYKGDAYFRITAYDRTNQIGSTVVSQSQKISVDNSPEAPTLVSPTDGYFDKDETPTFIFTIPDPRAGNSRLHFKIEIAQDQNFERIAYTFESRLDQAGWVYDSTGSGGWVPIPFDGIDIPSDPSLIGNQVKFTVQTEDRLAIGTYYWRVVAGGVI